MVSRIFLATVLLLCTALHQYAQTDIPDADDPIVFACDSTKAVCLRAGWDTNGDGELSYREAAAVTHLGEERFAVIRSVLSFDELQYFTGLRSIDRRALADTYNMATVTLPPQLEELDERAFWSATSITHITLPPRCVRWAQPASTIARNSSTSPSPAEWTPCPTGLSCGV